jgi:hypothetical protein
MALVEPPLTDQHHRDIESAGGVPLTAFQAKEAMRKLMMPLEASYPQHAKSIDRTQRQMLISAFEKTILSLDENHHLCTLDRAFLTAAFSELVRDEMKHREEQPVN